MLHAAIQLREIEIQKDHLEVVFDYLETQRNLAMIGLVYGESIHYAQTQLSLAGNRASLIVQDPDSSSSTRERAIQIQTYLGKYIDLLRQLQDEATDPKPTSTNVEALIDGVIHSKRLGSISVRRDFQDLRDRVVIAPQKLLRQVFFVIIQNAIDAMTGGGTLTIRAVAGEINQLPAVLATISDTGRGISLAQQAVLFKATYSDGSGNRRRGTHMGLMWARSFLRSYGGDITFVTGRTGTSMTVHIPRDFQIRAPEEAPELVIK